ncbi:P-loop containing nucleoside triphosphate hydrolase protein [Clohesyomyces aquaticus]|uniref:p-loop containing nucleoside triphosphate hydrolase protein n=1 Tax=Clohesyomyces aquaticus TaxID=1231657 RepID=A0A1Y1YPZ1_9PLEO|nr:P-loop containing nucleoside triphosphate hydrolase protein [Clohesyomyces aquaticus]
MIDYATYGRLHKKLYFPPLSPGPHDKWPKNLSLDMEEVQEQYILLPPNVHAFDMKEKEWRNLPIDDVEPIQWNKDAFQRLVLPKKTKDLVRALVMVRRPSQGKRENLYLFGDKNDVISGKGNGLILLLHGGPGTGKTLTAESVAELAEMPLYSVTCGDIGTTADSVEKYLHTVMYLGKTWNCVLLLDEADVFLEERTLSDLERNSLVSVFLRTLEYYDGILILTSNRIGTFDEAFKSRIQVALHYPSLDAPSRKKIWQGFLEMLAESDQDVDTEDILSHLDEIADHEMNGRQIRNVLATAHQLAIFKKQRLEWEHVELSLENAEQFNKYSRKLQGVSDTDRARDEKVRW